jgi:hypothetical protein
MFGMILIVICFSPVLLKNITGQHLQQPSEIGVGSKFQVILEFHNSFIYKDRATDREETHIQRVIGEVQLYSTSNSLYDFNILGLGHGVHAFKVDNRPLSPEYPRCEGEASGEFTTVFTGYVTHDDNDNAIVSISAYPISPKRLGQNLSTLANSFDPSQIATDSLQYQVSGPCLALSIPAGLSDEANVTKSEFQEGINYEKNVGNLEDIGGLTKTKMILSPPPLKYEIFGSVKSDRDQAMSNSKVVIVDAEELKKKLGKNYSPSTPLKLSDLQLPFEQKAATSDDENAKYSFTINGKGKILPTVLVVSLLWYDKEKGGGGEFAVTTGPEKDGRKIPIYMISCVGNLYPGCQPWKPNKARDGMEVELNFVYGDIEHPDMEKEDLYPRSPSRTVIQYDAAYVYYNSYKAIKYFESLKGRVSMSLNSVIIDVYNSIHSGCLDEKTKVDVDSAFYENTINFKTNNFGGLGTSLEPVKAIGGTVTICKLTSGASYPDVPDMREYHELGHYLQTAMYSKSPLEPNRVPHAGYENSGTNDSLGEGFATFVSLLINEHYKVGTIKTQSTYRLGETRIDVEKDYKVWGDHVKLVRDANGNTKVIDVNYNGPPDQEERAVTGILWDIHDKVSDRQSQLSTLYRTSVDMLSLPDWQILKIISDNEPMNLVQLHDNFRANVPQDKVDMIFINHGAFADTLIRNLVQEVPAELPGFTGDTRTDPDRHNRMKEPLTPGSYIIAQNDATFNISFIHEAPYGGYDYSYLVNMTKGKLTYFEMAPSYYPSKAMFDQVNLNGNMTLVKNTVTIDSDEYWDYISSNPEDNHIFKTIPSIVDNTQQKTYDIHEDPRFSGNNTLTNGPTDIQNNTQISNTKKSNSIPPTLNSPPTVVIPNSNVTVSNQFNSQVTTSNTTTMPPQNLTSPVPLESNNQPSNVSGLSPMSNETYVTIKLLPASSPLFFKCNVTSENGSSTLPGLNATASLSQVLTDNDSDTYISGNATLDIMFETPLADMPGPDLIINESGTDMESFSVGILTNDNATYGSLNVVGGSSGSTDNCGNQINTSQLDFSSIPHEGNMISGIRIDNDPDKNGGADISDITTINFGKLLTDTIGDKPTSITANDNLIN